jgi:hypothetical protein
MITLGMIGNLSDTVAFPVICKAGIHKQGTLKRASLGVSDIELTAADVELGQQLLRLYEWVWSIEFILLVDIYQLLAFHEIYIIGIFIGL